MSAQLPLVVIVGRPNVGKSTLFNRLTGSRRSIVTDEPGITRDRIYGQGRWNGRTFQVVDTGGIVPGEKESIAREILRQAEVAIGEASQIVLVVDAKQGVTPVDAELARLLRRTGKPLAIAANKVDSVQLTGLSAPFYTLARDVFPISAEHGLGVDELLDAVRANLPEGTQEGEAEQGVEVAIVGRPNVGKSTLLNRLAGAERAIVSEVPGTTRDAVDTLVRRGDKAYRFVDTAGIRRKGKTKLVAEKLSVVMARKQLERAEVALVVMDASQGVTSSDATIANYAVESGCAIILVMNKWDLALEAARAPMESGRAPKQSGRTQRTERPHPARMDAGRLLGDYERLVRAKLKALEFAPVVFLSAASGERTGKLFPLIDDVAAARRRRVSTGELNRWLTEVDLSRGTSPAGRRVKIYYMTQAGSSPPSFVLFTNQTRPLHFSFERFLENQLRARFDFTGTPIRFRQRLKKTRKSEIRN